MITEELERELRRSILKSSYYEFFKWSFSIITPNEKYEDAPHVKYLCDLYQVEIERMIKKEEKTTDIIVNVPPRSSKSLITSVSLNAWAWVVAPYLTFICVSFDDQLTMKNAQDCRDIIRSDEYQELFGKIFQIRKDSDSKGFYSNNKGGFRLSKTTGSNVTGFKGQVIVVDDPQNPKTSESTISRKSVIDYWNQSLFNRLTPVNLGVRILIQQRLHQEDLTGFLLEENPDSYRHVCLPAESSPLINPPELSSFYKDGLLDPIRLSKKTLLTFKSTLGTRGYAGQYGQTPAPQGGNLIHKEWFDIVDPVTLVRDIVNEPIMWTIDSAYTEKTENDPTAILTCFRRENFLYILDVQEVWKEFPDLLKFIVSYVKDFQYSEYSKIFIEPKASGKSVTQQLRSVTMLNVIESSNPDQDKVTRVNAIAPMLESRRVKLVAGAYVNKFLEQLEQFPNSTHDDKVDTLVIAVTELLISNNPDFLFLEQ